MQSQKRRHRVVARLHDHTCHSQPSARLLPRGNGSILLLALASGFSSGMGSILVLALVGSVLALA
eukprot:12139081-Prorocentrum_lima.AAC.1